MGRKFVKEATDMPARKQNLYWTPVNGATYNLSMYEQKVYATLGSAVIVNLILPNVVEAEGLTFSIFGVSIGGSSAAITLKALGARDWADLTVDVTNDAVILTAQGGKWWPVDNEIS